MASFREVTPCFAFRLRFIHDADRLLQLGRVRLRCDARKPNGIQLLLNGFIGGRIGDQLGDIRKPAVGDKSSLIDLGVIRQQINLIGEFHNLLLQAADRIILIAHAAVEIKCLTGKKCLIKAVPTQILNGAVTAEGIKVLEILTADTFQMNIGGKTA